MCCFSVCYFSLWETETLWITYNVELFTEVAKVALPVGLHWSCIHIIMLHYQKFGTHCWSIWDGNLSLKAVQTSKSVQPPWVPNSEPDTNGKVHDESLAPKHALFERWCSTFKLIIYDQSLYQLCPQADMLYRRDTVQVSKLILGQKEKSSDENH